MPTWHSRYIPRSFVVLTNQTVQKQVSRNCIAIARAIELRPKCGSDLAPHGTAVPAAIGRAYILGALSGLRAYCPGHLAEASFDARWECIERGELLRSLCPCARGACWSTSCWSCCSCWSCWSCWSCCYSKGPLVFFYGLGLLP